MRGLDPLGFDSQGMLKKKNSLTAYNINVRL